MEDYYNVIIHKDDIKKLELMADDLDRVNKGSSWDYPSITDTNEKIIEIIKILINGK